ncbi:MAG: DUF3108 domain-containing protein [Bdellovibrionales bacterium]|nr:DUF3108 domain-containing protein [Bdellovibrionales bacterium]
MTHPLRTRCFTEGGRLLRRNWAAAIITAACLLGSVSSVFADYIEPSAVNVKTERYIPAKSDFERGTYFYKVSWQGIPVAEARVVVDDEQLGDRPALKVKASAQTGDFIDIFYKLRFTSESVFDAHSFQPARFYSLQRENSREKFREVSFSDDGVIQANYIKNGKDREPREFRSENATFDPISAAFLARSLPLDMGAKKEFDVFNGKHRFLISFDIAAREVIEVRGRKYDAIKVYPTVQKLTDSEGEQRLKYAAIWISADDNREVLKLESKVLVGTVDAELVRFEPEVTAPRPVEVARASK